MQCNICNSKEFLFNETFKDYPLTNIFADEYCEAEKYSYDIEICQCKCGHVFANSASENFYTNLYPYNGKASGVQVRRNIGVAMLLRQIKTKNLNSAVDIGGGQLEMVREIIKHWEVARKIVIDPVPLKDETEVTDNIEFYNEYFNGKNFKIKKSDSPSLYILDNVLEHIHNLHEFLQGILECSNLGDYVYVCVPSRELITKKLQFQEIIHEHVNYFSLEVLEKLFGRYGFHQEIAFSDSSGHRCYNYHLFVRNNFQEETIKEPILNFDLAFNRYKTLLDLTLAQIDGIGSDVYGVCASELTPTLAYHMRSDFSFCRNIMDTSPHKLNKYMPKVKSKIVTMDDIPNLPKNAYYFVTAPTIAKYVLPNLSKYSVHNIILPIGML
jgi:hypothetical protein